MWDRRRHRDKGRLLWANLPTFSQVHLYVVCIGSFRLFICFLLSKCPVCPLWKPSLPLASSPKNSDCIFKISCLVFTFFGLWKVFTLTEWENSWYSGLISRPYYPGNVTDFWLCLIYKFFFNTEWLKHTNFCFYFI